jgi:hypothetical protein
MGTHTPAQAIQELVNHTAVLTERLVGLQGEVRKGMQQTPEWSNALTQVVGDTKRMLQAMEHLARLPAFHLDRDGLNAAVAAGVRMGMAEEGGSLASMIESNGKHLEEARNELTEAKARMDQLLGEVQNARSFKVDAQKKLFAQIAPIAGAWSVACVLLGVLIGGFVGGDDTPPTTQPVTSAVIQQPAPPPPQQSSQVSPPTSSGLVAGGTIQLPVTTQLYDRAQGQPSFNAPKGSRLLVESIRPDGWVEVSFALGGGQRGRGWVRPGVLQ